LDIEEAALRYLPVEIDVAGLEALCVGTSADLVSKVDRLLDAGARVVVIAQGPFEPALEERARAHEDDRRLTLQTREVELADLNDKAVTFFATNEAGRAAPFFERARREGRLFCTIDRPELSTFVNPAVARVQGLTMTFATGGTSPSVVRKIREDLETIFADPRFGIFLQALAALRAELPRGARAEKMAEAAKGFGLEGLLRFPSWVITGDRQARG
jgi:siroheme synthase-like protein